MSFAIIFFVLVRMEITEVLLTLLMLITGDKQNLPRVVIS